MWALALSTIAARNADSQDRIWIADIHHTIFCGSSRETRQEAELLFVVLRRRFAHIAARAGDREEQDAKLVRTCTTGEPVAVPRRE